MSSGGGSRWQFSLRALLISMALVALAFSGIVHPSALVSDLMFALTVGGLLAALLLALFGDGRGRPFAGGFAVSGWLYLFLISATYQFPPIGDPIVYSRGYWPLPEKLVFRIVEALMKSGDLDPRFSAEWVQSVTVGHLLLTLVVAFAGGLFAAYVHSRKSKRSHKAK